MIEDMQQPFVIMHVAIPEADQEPIMNQAPPQILRFAKERIEK